MSGTSYSTDVASKQYKTLMGNIEFTSPKSVQFIQDLITYSTDPDENIVLDFFAGSGTTAHAIFLRNIIDDGNRRFILVQIPEDVEPDSVTFKAGYKKISDITKERIRKASSAIYQDISSKDLLKKPDLGFRVLKVDSSCMKEVFYTPDSISKDLIADQVNNIREDRTHEDLLFQVLLDWGIDLALPIAKEFIQGKEVLFVDGNALAACFDVSGGIDEGFVKDLAKHQPMRVVFRDSGFKDSAVKINVEQIFKQLSPSTEVKCL
jgi:adenine-specific DNA-methyltransferase